MKRLFKHQNSTQEILSVFKNQRFLTFKYPKIALFILILLFLILLLKILMWLVLFLILIAIATSVFVLQACFFHLVLQPPFHRVLSCFKS
ncbi:hypothetical protein COV15_01150 [Candidatus Woesearchaeota archaeon CG10_big_fil_rev_8_21_14_0_10_34_12]|nr:MAG: hypothetical protein COV15_01150 [Candidatus Woesearchaeota archaeon CG10_big_fil_rev_8_21_14_0_10_34_12]